MLVLLFGPERTDDKDDRERDIIFKVYLRLLHAMTANDG